MDLSSLQSRPSSSSLYIPPHRTQLHARLIQYPNPIPKPSNSYRDRRFILVSSLLVLPFLFYIFSTALAVHRSPKFSEPKRNLFGVVISAGPLGSRVHVYEFIGNLRLNWVDLSSTKVRPGLRMFSSDPEGAGSSIKKLILFAKERIPRSEWRDTKVLLIASEELEKLTLDARNAVMESCRRVLRSSGFLFKNDWADIVRDQEEAIYAWVAANYAHGLLGVEAQETTGIVELGGNSMQVVFSNRDPPSLQPLRLIKFGGIIYKLYIQSTSYLGQDAAWKAFNNLQKSKVLSVPNSKETGPCIPRGYGRNSRESNIKLSSDYMGNFSTCKSQAMALLKTEGTQGECLHQPCEMTLSSYLQLPGKPVQHGRFIFISEFFGVVNKASLSELERAGHHYCDEDWTTLKIQHSNMDDLDLVKHCFSSAYLTAALLLHNNTLSSILTDDHDHDQDHSYYNTTDRKRTSLVDWTLGAFIVQTMSEPLEVEASINNNPDEIIGGDAVTYFSLFALLLVAVLVSLFIIKCQKPKVRTIFDLEKGRYIITQPHG